MADHIALSSSWSSQVADSLTSSWSSEQFLSVSSCKPTNPSTNQPNNQPTKQQQKKGMTLLQNPWCLYWVFKWGFPISIEHLYLLPVLQAPLDGWSGSSGQNTKLQKLFFNHTKALLGYYINGLQQHTQVCNMFFKYADEPPKHCAFSSVLDHLEWRNLPFILEEYPNKIY